MIDEIKKSINSIFEERVSSPFYGTLIISWLIWNWKIVYLTFFVDQDKLDKIKIDFIMDNYNDVWHLVYFPLISTFTLITIIPFLTNGAYWLDLKFTTWRVNQKNEIEGKRLLTLEQSIKLRSELRELEESFDKLLEKKNEEIKVLKDQFETSSIKDVSQPSTRKTSKGTNYSISDYRSLQSNGKAFMHFSEIVKSIKSTNQFPEKLEEDVKEYYLVNEIIYGQNDGYNGKDYFLTFKGEQMYKEFFNNNFK
ncbi:hypothetical protein NLG42_05635 [Flavobacterium plurextorum]|uniref:hypothetical protein n=1 Tax=Flavobacterium TaxID=237 RepID=UPI00214DB454|nr:MULTISPECIES: hypothetical protein [Flavobacterium]UUW10284.1 hypothetical protein NLG42_05635 [Flavobacterium plurextorum]